jgi:hypothetical protein
MAMCFVMRRPLFNTSKSFLYPWDFCTAAAGICTHEISVAAPSAKIGRKPKNHHKTMNNGVIMA